jgi:hypothetical protein
LRFPARRDRGRLAAVRSARQPASRGDATPLGQQDLDVTRALADTATVGILQERAIRRGEVLTEQLQTALNSRVVIEQAKGVLFHAAGIPMDQAFQRLRSYSRSHNMQLSVVAEDLARGTLDPRTILIREHGD